jgi:hypothetical protein
MMRAINTDTHIRFKDLRFGLSRHRTMVADIFSAIAEGLASAQYYDELTLKAGGELAALGLKRADLSRFAVLGRY